MNILKNALLETSAVILIQNIRTVIFYLFPGGNKTALSFPARQFSELQSEIIFAQSVKKNAFIIVSLRYCMHQQTSDIHHKPSTYL
jgi:hypothetical protein